MRPVTMTTWIPASPAAAQRRARARAEDAVLADQRAVEVARDRGDVARKSVGEAQAGVAETYAATSAIACSLSCP